MRSAARRNLDQEKAQRMMGLLSDLLSVSEGVVGCALRLSTTKALDDALARRLGPEFFDLIADTAGDVLADMVGPPNFFFKKSAMTFIVIFVSLDEAQAASFCENAQLRIIQTLKLEHNISQVLLDIMIDTLTTAKLEANPVAWAPGEAGDKGDIQRAFANAQRSKDELDDIELILRPARDLRRDEIDIYLVQLRREFAPGKFDYGYSVRNQRSDLKTIAYFDCKILEYCAELATSGLPADRPYMLIAPINYPSYKTGHLQPLYQAILAKMSDMTRRRLMIEMVGVSDSGLRQTLQWDIERLSRQCRGAILQTSAQARGFSWVRSLKVAAIGTSVFKERAADPQLMKRLQEFMADTEFLGLPRFLTGVQETAMIDLARKQGFRFASGPIIGEDVFARPIRGPQKR